MSINLYVNTEPQSISKAIVQGTTQPQAPIPVREFVQGAEQTINLYLIDPDGSYDSRSGTGGVGVKVSIAARNAQPTQGTFTLTDGTATTSAITYNASAATVEAALNALNSNTGPSGDLVDVVKKGDGCYVVTYRTVGAVATLAGTSVDLSPESSIVGAESIAGDATTREQQVIELTAQPLIFQDTWAQITNGWSATLSANNTRIVQALGGADSIQSYIEVKIDDVVLAQQDVTIYASASNVFSAAAAQVPSALTTSDIGVSVQPYQIHPPGWAQYEDSVYTSSNKLAVTAGTRTMITIDGLGANTNKSYLPSGVSDFWDATNSEITPENIGDSYDVRFDFVADPGQTTESVLVELDIGDGNPSIVIVSTNAAFPESQEQPMSVNFSIFSLATFVANGGKIYVTPTSNFDFWDFSVFIKRDFSPYSSTI